MLVDKEYMGTDKVYPLGDSLKIITCESGGRLVAVHFLVQDYYQHLVPSTVISCCPLILADYQYCTVLYCLLLLTSYLPVLNSYNQVVSDN